MRKYPRQIVKTFTVQKTSVVSRIGFAIQVGVGFVLFVTFFGALFSVVGILDIQHDGFSQDFLESAQTPVVPGSPFYLSVWYPFQVCYNGSCPGGQNYRLLPNGWPSSTTDSNRIVATGANTVVGGTGYFGQHYTTTPADPDVVALLDWAEDAGIKADLDDLTLWAYIKGSYPMSSQAIQDHINRLVQNYGSHPGLGGWYLGNEPEGWGSTPQLKEGMYARLGDVVTRFKAADPNHRVYTTTASAAKLRFCREGRMSILLNTGASYLRPGTVADDSQEFQDLVDRAIYNFDEDYLCTKNYNIPFAYSLAASYWAGDTITSAETEMYAYALLAHGGQGIEWFPYSTTGGLVWDNQAPAYTLNFQNWLPAMQGGLIYQDSTYQNVVGFSNIGLNVDNSTKHGGNSAARMNISGPVTNYYNLRINPPENANSPWNPKFPELKANTDYRMSGWVKTAGSVTVQMKAVGPGGVYSYSTTTVSGTTDWTEISQVFTTPATIGKWAFGPWVNSTGTGTVWFDDFSLVEVGDATQRNIAEDYNPGFETVTGADRTPHEPLYSTVQQLNSDLAILGPIFSSLTKVTAFNDQEVPNTGLVTALSAQAGGTPSRAEMGIFSSADVNGEYYLVAVNRNITSAADVSFTVNAAAGIVLEDVVAGTSQSYPASGGTVPVTLTLQPGEGKAYHVLGIRYNAPTGTTLSLEDFEDGQAQGWATSGGTWSIVDESGNSVYDVLANTDARGIDTSLVAGNFEYSGRFKIMSDHSAASILHFTFRKDASNPSLSAQQYNFRLALDPGAESTNGYVQMVRTSASSAVICQVNDENFLLGDRYIDFRIRGIGNTFEAEFDGIKYLTCIDSSPEALTAGQIGFRIYSGGHVRLDDLSVRSMALTDTACQESWTCSEWSACASGTQTRTCTDINSCGTTFIRPPLSQSCSVNANSNANANSNTNTNANANSNVNATPPCTEQWICTEWLSCIDGQQSRTCTDQAACGTESTRPALTQSCTVPIPDPAPCTPDWQCGDWSACTPEGQQQRHCTDRNACSIRGNENGVDEYRQCSPVGGSSDTTAPETDALQIPAEVYTNSLTVTLGGSDDETARENLRYFYRLDGASQQLTPNDTTLRIQKLANGQHTLSVWAVDESGNEDVSPSQATFTIKRILRIVTGTGPGGGPHVRVLDYRGNVIKQFFAYAPGFRGGVRVTTGDVDGDGYDEIITAAGRGGGPHVRIFNANGKVLSQFFAFPTTFRGGITVASGDVDADGTDEILVTPVSGGGPLVRIFDSSGKLKGQFFAYVQGFRGGVNLASGDLNQDGRDEIITAPASAGGPHVRALELLPTGTRVMSQFYPYPASRRMGMELAVADVLKNDGIPEIITSPTEGGFIMEVKLFSPRGLQLASFFPTSANYRKGLSVAAGDLYDFDNAAEIITATYKNDVPGVFIFKRKSATVLQRIHSFYAYTKNFRGGVFVSTGHFPVQ